MKLALGLAALALVAMGCAAPPTTADAVPTATLLATTAPVPTATPDTRPPSAAPRPTWEPSAPDEVVPADPLVARLGETVPVGDWAVAITKVNWNARAALKKANMFNDPAPKGTTPVMVYIKATYMGTGRASIGFDAGYSLRGLGLGSATEYTTFENPTCGVTPDPDPSKTVRTGGTVVGWAACWVVDNADLDTLTAFWAPSSGPIEVGFTLRK